MKIIINGQPAQLQEDFKTEMVFRNPLLDYTQVIGSYSTPLSLPFCKANNIIFSNAGSFYSTENTSIYKIEIYLSDTLVAEGYIRLKDTNKAYNVYFTSNLGEIFEGKKDDDLSNILGSVTIASREAQIAGTPSVIFPTIQNTGFYQANPPGGWANMVNDYNDGDYIGPTYVAAIQIKYILSQIADACNFTLSGAFMADEDMDRLYIMQNIESTSLTIPIGEILKGFTPRTFLAALRQAIGLVVVVDVVAKTMAIDFAKTFFDAEVTANYSAICGNPISGREPMGYSGIKLNYEINQDDKQATTATILETYATTTTEPDAKYYEISSPFSPIPISGGLPIMNEQGRTATNKQDTKKLAPRIMFYKGLIETTFGDRPVADYIFNTYDLSNSGRKTSLFATEETFWKNTFATSFPIRNLGRINLNDLRSKVHIHGINYMPKEIIVNSQNPTVGVLKCLKA